MPVFPRKSQPSIVRLQNRLATSLILSTALFASVEGSLFPQSAQAAPARKDWCGTIWSVENQNTLAWINPASGTTVSNTGPTAQITMPGGSMGTAVAAIGIHKESGTMFAFDRTGTTGKLYKYKFGVDTSWVPLTVTGLLGLSGTQSIAGASNNLNKMTVDGNTLFIAESNGVAVYAIPLNTSGAVIGGATVQTYSFVGDPAGTPPHRSSTNADPTGTEIINGGDIVTDEYGDVYNITYNSIISYSGTTQILTTTKAYFYQQDPVAKTWVYQGQTTGNQSFAGAAFYRGDLYVKAGTQLKIVDLTRTATGYTGWNNPLVNIGAASSTSSADLAACGTPIISLTKTRQVYSDAALTTLVADPTKVKTGQYIKYTIAAKNVGDAWARSTQIIDNLPIGTVYQANSATLNGTNLGLASYPTAGFTVNSPSITAGIVRYPTDPDTATLTFVVEVTATSGVITNQATTSYVDGDGLPSDPPVCTTTPKVNCANDGPGVTVVPDVVLDYGDAPDTVTGTGTGNYQTLASDGGPSHAIISGLSIGASVDGDSGSLQDATATADDTNGSADDEDGVASFPALTTTPGQAYSVPVNVTHTAGGNAYLVGYIDFNKDGDFADAGEQSAPVTVTASGSQNVSFTTPAGMSAGNTYARFRLSKTLAEVQLSIGAATSGEVEDYQVPIVTTPDITCPTGTTATGSGYATGGVGQYLTKNAIYWLDWSCGGTAQFIPGKVVTKSWTAPNGIVVTATVSNITKTLRPYNTGDWGGDKLDDLYNGVNPIGLLNAIDGEDPSYTINFSMTLNGVPIQSDIVTAEAEDTGGPNESASWTTDGNPWEVLEVGPNSLISAAFTNANQTISMQALPNLGGGTLLALTENVSNINVNMKAGGQEAIAFGIMVPFDHGDAPTSYGAAPHFARRDASGGAKPTTDTNVNSLTMATLGYSTPYLGAIGPDPESVAFSTAAGAAPTADNTNGSNDEDAFAILPNVPASGSYSLNNIPVNNTSGTTATLHAWIDFNQNGTFEASEYTSVAIANNATTANLNWANIPAGTAAGSTYARFRITTQAITDDAATAAIDERSTATAIDGEVEDYSVTIATPSFDISGTVFEDPNYGGGAGRPFSTATTSPRQNARVELYDATGLFKGFTLTDANGLYKFDSSNVTGGIAAGDYKVRVVNSTVTSSRPGYVAGLLPVQTFRTDASTGTVTDVTDRVGGEKPAETDAPANTTANLSTLDTATQEVQSITTVKVGSSAVTGIDFGYNFDTIVNTNNAGQGSLRQFVTNSNSLTNAGLAQVGQTPGQEVSIFMISDGAAHPGLNTAYATGLNGTGGNANAAVISLSSQLVITDNNTSIDARTQTTNVSDSNTGTMGTGGTVGVDGLTLDLIPKPELVLNFSPMPVVNGNANPTGGGSNPIVVQGQSTTLAGFAFYGYQIQLGLAGLNKGMIWINPTVTDTGKATITQLFGGIHADGSKAPTNALVGAGIQTSGGAEIYNNYFAYLADATEFDNLNGTKANFFNNELAFNGPQTTSNSNMSGLYADQLETGPGSKNITVRGNLVRNSNKINATSAQGQGIQISNSTFVTIENNSFIDNNIFGINVSASDSLIQKNIVTGTKNGPGFTQGSGIIVYYGGTPLTGLRNRISQNSIYQNVKLGIDLQIDGVTPNDGLVSATQPNNGIDYPIVTSSLLSGNDLVVKGYVGNVAAGSPTFANVTLEFFIADDDGSNNGKVFSTDPATVSKPHGEGKTYIGTCTTNGSSLFDCTFANVNNLMPSGQTFDPKNITATATDAAGNTSEFSSTPMANNPNVLLVKRITAINASTSTFGGDSLAGYIDELTNAYDDNTITIPTQPTPTAPPIDTDKWPTLNSFMLGGINGGNIKPNDEVEYTIYFLSAGLGEAKNVLFCDRVPSNVSFIPTAFNSATPAAGGLAGDRGILSLLNGTTAAFTNIADGDAARYFPPGSNPTSIYPNLNCGGTNSNGAIVVNLGNLPNATAPGTPAGAFGFVRFKGRVK